MRTRNPAHRLAALAALVGLAVGLAACHHRSAPGDEPWTDIEPVVDQGYRPFAVASDTDYFYWLEYTNTPPDSERIFRIARTGGATELLHAQAGGILDLAVDDDGLYFLDGSAVYRLDKAGGTPERLHDQGNGESLVLHAGRLFWGARDDADALVSVRTDGSDPQVHYAGRARGRIAIDDTHIYFGDEATGNVLAQPYPGTAAPIQVGTDDCATDVALGPTHVYWLSQRVCGTSGGEALVRAPRADVADPDAAEPVEDMAWGLIGNGAEVFFTDSRDLFRVTDGVPSDIASVRELTCETSGPQTTCRGPTDLYIDPLGVALCGWSGQGGGTGWLGFVARP